MPSQLSENEAEAPDVAHADLLDQTRGESGCRLGGGGRSSEVGVHDTATGFEAGEVLSFFTEVSQDGDAALSGDAEPGALDGALEVAAAEDVGVGFLPPVCG